MGWTFVGLHENNRWISVFCPTNFKPDLFMMFENFLTRANFDRKNTLKSHECKIRMFFTIPRLPTIHGTLGYWDGLLCYLGLGSTQYPAYPLYVGLWGIGMVCFVTWYFIWLGSIPRLPTIRDTLGYWSGLFCYLDWAQNAPKHCFMCVLCVFRPFTVSITSFSSIADFMVYTLYVWLWGIHLAMLRAACKSSKFIKLNIIEGK